MTSGHSRGAKRHAALQAIFVAWYNFCRKHETLGGSGLAAIASGLAGKAWSVQELLERMAG